LTQPDSAAFREYFISILYEVQQLTKSSKPTSLKIEHLLFCFRSYDYAVTHFSNDYVALATRLTSPLMMDKAQELQLQQIVLHKQRGAGLTNTLAFSCSLFCGKNKCLCMNFYSKW